MDRPASTASLSVGNQAGRRSMVVSPQFFSFFDRDGYGSAFLGSRSRFSQFVLAFRFQEPLFSVWIGMDFGYQQ